MQSVIWRNVLMYRTGSGLSHFVSLGGQPCPYLSKSFVVVTANS